MALEAWPLADSKKISPSPIPWYKVAERGLYSLLDDRLLMCKDRDLQLLRDLPWFDKIPAEAQAMVRRRLGEDASEVGIDSLITDEDGQDAMKILRQVLRGELDVDPKLKVQVALRFLDKRAPDAKPVEVKSKEERSFIVNTGVPEAE